MGRAERSGGLAMSPPGTSRDRSQNYLISIIYKSQGNGGLDKGGERQENISQKNKYLEVLSLDIEPDWQKIILIIFCPTT